MTHVGNTGTSADASEWSQMADRCEMSTSIMLSFHSNLLILELSAQRTFGPQRKLGIWGSHGRQQSAWVPGRRKGLKREAVPQDRQSLQVRIIASLRDNTKIEENFYTAAWLNGHFTQADQKIGGVLVC